MAKWLNAVELFTAFRLLIHNHAGEPVPSGIVEMHDFQRRQNADLGDGGAILLGQVIEESIDTFKLGVGVGVDANFAQLE